MNVQCHNSVIFDVSRAINKGRKFCHNFGGFTTELSHQIFNLMLFQIIYER